MAYVKLVSAHGSAGSSSWVEVELLASDDVADFADRACAKFRSWDVDASRISLFLVAAAGADEPPAAAIAVIIADDGKRLRVNKSLSDVDVRAGSWLVARVSAGAAAVGDASRDVAAATAALWAVIAALPARIVALLSVDHATTVLSDVDYEEQARRMLPAVLLRRCGLEVVADVDACRDELAGLQWDFRVPVCVTELAPHPNTDASFEVFPQKTHYERPAAVPARHVTSKFRGKPVPPPAHYLAIFEVTVARKWTHPSSKDPGLLDRLEQRLAISLDRARSAHVAGVERISDLVAVVGVVAPASYTDSVRSRMCKPSAPPLLKELMDASRFVFIAMPRASAVS